MEEKQYQTSVKHENQDITNTIGKPKR